MFNIALKRFFQWITYKFIFMSVQAVASNRCTNIRTDLSENVKSTYCIRPLNIPIYLYRKHKEVNETKKPIFFFILLFSVGTWADVLTYMAETISLDPFRWTIPSRYIVSSIFNSASIMPHVNVNKVVKNCVNYRSTTRSECLFTKIAVLIKK